MNLTAVTIRSSYIPVGAQPSINTTFPDSSLIQQHIENGLLQFSHFHSYSWQIFYSAYPSHSLVFMILFHLSRLCIKKKKKKSYKVLSFPEKRQLIPFFKYSLVLRNSAFFGAFFFPGFWGFFCI